MTQKTETVTVKIVGSRTALQHMIQNLKENYLFTSKTRILPNDGDHKFHAFIDINPFYLKTNPLEVSQ